MAHLRSVNEGEMPGFNKEYCHRPEEVTKAIVSTKIKMVHRAIAKLLTLVEGVDREEWCQEIRGGSPATEQVRSGLESGDLLDRRHVCWWGYVS